MNGTPGRDIPGDPLPESRFIEPTFWCPHPDRWTSTDGDSTEIEVTALIAGLVRGLQPRLVVETGAAFGQTTHAIADALERNGHGQLITFETDSARRDLLSPHPLVEVHGSSLDADLSDRPPIDVAFLDSFYETRIPEFLHLRQWMRPGTIVAFHDTADGRGSHRIPSGQTLRQEIESELITPAYLAGAIDLPTPRGLTIGEVM